MTSKSGRPACTAARSVELSHCSCCSRTRERTSSFLLRSGADGRLSAAAAAAAAGAKLTSRFRCAMASTRSVSTTSLPAAAAVRPTRPQPQPSSTTRLPAQSEAGCFAIKLASLRAPVQRHAAKELGRVAQKEEGER